MFDFIKQIEEIIEPYRANIAQLFDTEFLKKVVHGYHAAYFSCASLQLGLKTLQRSSCGLQLAFRLLKQVFTVSFG